MTDGEGEIGAILGIMWSYFLFCKNHVRRTTEKCLCALKHEITVRSLDQNKHLNRDKQRNTFHLWKNRIIANFSQACFSVLVLHLYWAVVHLCSTYWLECVLQFSSLSSVTHSVWIDFFLSPRANSGFVWVSFWIADMWLTTISNTYVSLGSLMLMMSWWGTQLTTYCLCVPHCQEDDYC